MNNLVIWKEEIEIEDTISLLLPKGSKILSCQVQNGVICIWYRCDPKQEKEVRVLRIFGTGHPISDDLNLKFIDTIQTPPFVWHIFELIEVRN